MEAAPFLAAGAAGVSAIGSIHQGQSQAAAARFNAQVSEQNAQIVRQQAAEEESRARREGRRLLGRQRAAIGASGIQVEGSPLDVLADTAAELELDALTVRHRGLLEALGLTQQASLDRARARSARTAGFIGAGASLLSGAAEFGKNK